MKAKDQVLNHYLSIWFGSSLFLVFFIFLFNYIVDPLWFNDGSKLTKTNYAYNERISKINHFLNHKDEFDCLVFGSSVSIVFDTRLLEDFKCFNFSVSAGGLQEFIEYMKYLKWVGYRPEKIYTEINFGFVEPNEDLSRMPKFIIDRGKPTTIFKSYTSISSLLFSIKSIFHISPYQHVYDENIVAHVRMELTQPFKPNKEDIYKTPAEPPSYNIVSHYRELVEIFPDVNHIGYVYPASPWDTSRYYTHGYLDTNLEIISELSTIFDELYDFSFPTPLINDTSSTYDGSHFYEHIFEEIADTMNNKEGVVGYRVTDQQKYKKDYIQKIYEFINSI